MTRHLRSVLGDRPHRLASSNSFKKRRSASVEGADMVLGVTVLSFIKLIGNTNTEASFWVFWRVFWREICSLRF